MLAFEWDENKNRSNRLKHKVSFETAKTVFFDPFLLYSEMQWAGSEERWKIVGSAGEGQVLAVVVSETVTEWSDIYIRIISARKATKYEEREYRQVQI